MPVLLAKKVAQRVELTGSAPRDRAQVLAQQVGKAHEITKATVQALANTAYVAIAKDTGNVAAGAYADLVSVSITTVLKSGSLDITFTASGTQNVGSGATLFFQVLVDGVVLKGLYQTTSAGYAFNAAIVTRKSVTVGTHVVKVQWKTNAGSAHISTATVVEEHAALIVREAP